MSPVYIVNLESSCRTQDVRHAADLPSELWVKTLLALEKKHLELSEICGFSFQIWDEIKLQLISWLEIIHFEDNSTAEVLVLLEFTALSAPCGFWHPFLGDMVYLSDPAPRWILKGTGLSKHGHGRSSNIIQLSPRCVYLSRNRKCLKLPNALDLGECVWVVPGEIRKVKSWGFRIQSLGLQHFSDQYISISETKHWLIWVCLKIGYIPNYSHLIGIMIINHWV